MVLDSCKQSRSGDGLQVEVRGAPVTKGAQVTKGAHGGKAGPQPSQDL